jgi:hypothetical protein
MLVSPCYAVAHDVDDEAAADHYLSRRDAEAAQLGLLLDQAADVPPVLELPGRCLTVTCDRCGAALGDDPGLHLTVAELAYELLDTGWLTFSGRHVCYECVPVMLALLVYGTEVPADVAGWPVTGGPVGGVRCP